MTLARRCFALLASGALLLALATVAPVGSGLSGAASATTADGAARTSTYLCTGYDACAEAGYSSSGYKKNSKTMWWRMYAGHNCTNYAAYRMVRSGMANERPWDGEGNASNWGHAMSRITDDQPRVGAVAWWDKNVPGAGSAGHVAYVERVVSPTEIVISEDSWGGDFHWRTVYKTGSGWPTGFVHFNDRAVEMVEPPSLSSRPKVGVPTTARLGSWSPKATKRVRWYADGEPIKGAREATYTPTPAMRGKRLTVEVVARAKGYEPATRRVRSLGTQPGDLAVTAPPVISGDPMVDERLSVSRGQYAPRAGSAKVQWYADGRPIADATGWRLTLDQPEIGTRITARVTAQATGYRPERVASAATEPVLAGEIEILEPFSVAGSTRIGRTLTVRPGTVSPADADVSYTWLRDGVPVTGASGTTYTLGPADVGHRVTLRVDLAKTHYRSLSESVVTEGVVTTVPEVRVRAVGRPGRAVVVTRVVAPGVPEPTGRITVRVGGSTVEARLVDGRARVVVPDVRPGKRPVVVRYAGTRVVEPGRPGRTTVRVEKPRHQHH